MGRDKELVYGRTGRFPRGFDDKRNNNVSRVFGCKSERDPYSLSMKIRI